MLAQLFRYSRSQKQQIRGENQFELGAYRLLPNITTTQMLTYTSTKEGADKYASEAPVVIFLDEAHKTPDRIPKPLYRSLSMSKFSIQHSKQYGFLNISS